jgi:hypothetical protein
VCICSRYYCVYYCVYYCDTYLEEGQVDGLGEPVEVGEEKHVPLWKVGRYEGMKV